MPFIVISDPVEAHKYRQAGMLWYRSGSAEWVALSNQHDKTVDLDEELPISDALGYSTSLFSSEPVFPIK